MSEAVLKRCAKAHRKWEKERGAIWWRCCFLPRWFFFLWGRFIFSLLLLSLKGKMVNIPFLYDGLKWLDGDMKEFRDDVKKARESFLFFLIWWVICDERFSFFVVYFGMCWAREEIFGMERFFLLFLEKFWIFFPFIKNERIKKEEDFSLLQMHR